MEHDPNAVRKIVLRMLVASLDRDQEAADIVLNEAMAECPHCVLSCLVGLAQAKTVEAEGSPEAARAWAQGLLLGMAS